MATATSEIVSKAIVKTVTEPVIRLELSEEEAKFILAMTLNIAGNSETTYRKISESLCKTLNQAKVRADSSDFFVRNSRYGYNGLMAKDVPIIMTPNWF